MRALVDAAMVHIAEHIGSLPEQPTHAVTGGRKLWRSLREPLPEGPVAFERLLSQLFGKIIPASINTAAPGYLAYIPGGGLFHSAVADLIADATNRYVGVFQAAPGLVAIESNVISWFAEILGFPQDAGGILTTGGSMANFTALVTARRERLPEDFLRGTLYCSVEAHHSVKKAAILAGFPAHRVREIPSDDRFRMKLPELKAAIARDRAEGLTPFFVAAAGGTTATGAVDDLEGIAAIAKDEQLWLHVDAAYGGFFALTERGRRALGGIELADSVTLDPHKSLFLPYGTGSLVVRDVEALRRAHSLSASYLPTMQTEPGLYDFCELSPELSRDARGLRVWLPLKMHGAGVFRDALDEKLDLAGYAAEALRAMPEVEIVAEPQLSLLAFRYRPGDVTGSEALDKLNHRLITAVNARQRVLLTGAVVHGQFVVRICVLSFRTHREHIDACLEDIAAAIAELRG